MSIARLALPLLCSLFVALVSASPSTGTDSLTSEPGAVTAAQGALYLPLVGHFDRADLAAPDDGSWRYYGATNRVLDVDVDMATGAVFAATAGGLVRWDPAAGTHERLSLRQVDHVALTSDGAQWVTRVAPGGPPGGGEIISRRAPDGTWRDFTAADGLPTGYFADLVADRSGGVWAGWDTGSWHGGVPANGGLAHIAAAGQITTYGVADGWPSQDISRLVPDLDGGVWFTYGTQVIDDEPMGVGHVTAEGEAQFTDESSGLPATYLEVQAVDLDGSLLATRWEYDEAPDHIYRRTPDGQWHEVHLPGFEWLEKWVDFVAVDQAGRRVFISSLMTDGVRMQPDGTLQSLIDYDEPTLDFLYVEVFLDLRAVTFGVAGDVWLAAGELFEGLLRNDASGAWQMLSDPGGSAPGGVSHVAASSLFDAYVVGLHDYGMYRVSPDGVQSEASASPGGSSWRPLAVDTAGDVWVPGYGNLLRLSPDGTREPVALPEGVYGQSYRLASAPDGALWLGAGGAHRRSPKGEWTHLSTADGLATDSVVAFAFDARGGIWMGTTGYSTRDPDTLQDVFIPGGVSYLDSVGTLTTYTHTLLAEEYLTALTTDPDGGLWVGTMAGMLKLEPDKQWSVIDPPDAVSRPAIRSLAVDRIGRLWVGTDGQGFHRLDGGGIWTSWQMADGLAGPSVRDILVDDDDNVWLAVDRNWSDSISESGAVGGLQRIAADGSWQTYRTPLDPVEEHALFGHGVVGLAMDGEGRVLCASGNEQLWRLDPDGTFKTLVPIDFLPSSTVTDLVVAAAGDVWAATPRGLAHRSKDDGWWTLHTADGLPTGSVMGLAVDEDGAVWAGLGPAWDAVAQQWRSTGVVQVGEAGDMTRVDLPLDQAGLGIHALAFDLDGGLWVATHELVDKYASGNWQPQGVGVSHRTAGGQWSHYRPDGERHLDEVRGIAVDGEGTAWFATDNGLVARQQGGQWQDARDGLLSLDVQSVAAGPDGRLWITTAAGVQRLGPDGTWQSWTTTNGLSDDFVYDLAFDSQGRAWLGTRTGGVTVMPAVRE